MSGPASVPFTKGIGTATTTAAACSHSKAVNGQRRTLPVTYRCKQKQYNSVLWSLQFLLALLRHSPWRAPSSGYAPVTQYETNPGTLYSDPATYDRMPTHSSSLHDAVGRLLQATDGAVDSFDVEGPLSSAHLRALQQSLTDDQVRELCDSCVRHYVQEHYPQPHVGLAFKATLFAHPTPLMQLLWPTEAVRMRYTAALAAAHRQRIDHSDLLALPGYLQEAGLHAIRVFTSAGNDDGSETGTRSNPAERRAAAAWGALIDAYTAFLPDRSHIHELENLPQEVAIGELLCEAAAGVPLDCVVDVGGGNGFLAAQVAERLGCDGAVIDPFFPAHAIDCCPRIWPDTAARTRPSQRRRRTLHRTCALFGTVAWAEAVPAEPSRTALIAKHLCGSGVDEVLHRLAAQDCLPRLLVLAPCCFHRCTLDTYSGAGFIAGLLGLSCEEAFAHMTRLTDWNASVYQRLQGGEGGASKKSIRHLVSCPEGIAAAVEAVVNYGRVQWLQAHGYEVEVVEYVPDCVTPKNRCLVARRILSADDGLAAAQ